VPLEVVELVGDPFELLLGVGLDGVEGKHFLVVGVDQVDQLVVVGLLLVLVLQLGLPVLQPQFLQLPLFGVDLGLQLLLPALVVLRQGLVEFLLLLVDLLVLALLIVPHFPDLALQLVYLLLLLLRVPGSLLPQVNQVRLAVGLGLLKRLDLCLQVLYHLDVTLLLLGCRRQHLLHYDLVVRERLKYQGCLVVGS
jgi:hypothetical protein